MKLIEAMVVEKQEKPTVRITHLEVVAENEKYIAVNDDYLTKLEKATEGQEISKHCNYIEIPKIDSSPWGFGIVISGLIYTREDDEKKALDKLFDSMYEELTKKVDYFEEQRKKLLTEIIED